MTEATVAAATTVAGAVSPEMLGGVLNEVIALLPTVIPVMIGFIALRKGIAFLQGILRAA